MDIVIDFNEILDLAQNPFAVQWYLFIKGAWVIYLFALLWGGWSIYLKAIRDRFDAGVEYILLAIDIPKDNEQTPKAVEQIFAHLTGIWKKGNLIERYIKGHTQRALSFEIVSIGGYIQFLTRIPIQFRDMVEAAVFAQYPQAEITEVEDYTRDIPDYYPNDEYDLWGTQFTLQKDEVYPIVTYPSMEHTLTQQYVDPMASTLEIFSRMQEGEQAWLQIVIWPPLKDLWKDKGFELVKKIIGRNKKGEERFIKALQDFGDIILPTGEVEKKIELPSMMMHLSPGEKKIVEGIQEKISKLGFYTKIRMIYVARKEKFNKSTRKPALAGAMRQFNTLDMNGFVVNKKIDTKVEYFFKKSRIAWRQRKLMKAYKLRSGSRGVKAFVLNIEELASIFHFPVMTVKAPAVQKIQAKRAEPPTSLPLVSEKPEGLT